MADIWCEARDEILVCKEPFEGGFRTATIYFESEESTSFPMMLLYCLGWKPKVVLFEQTLQGWFFEDRTIPILQNDRERIIKAFADYERSRGNRVKIESRRPRLL